jgi:hypothetical protein
MPAFATATPSSPLAAPRGADARWNVTCPPVLHGSLHAVSTFARTKMSATAGERAAKTGDFRCEKCHQKTRLTAGKPIPACPNCGNKTYDTRVNEPGKKSP